MKSISKNLLLAVIFGLTGYLYAAQPSIIPVAQMLRQWGTDIVPDIIRDPAGLKSYAAMAAKTQRALDAQASGTLSDEDALQRAIKESLQATRPAKPGPSSLSSASSSSASAPWDVASVPGALREIGARVRLEQDLASSDDLKELVNLMHLNNVTEYQEWQYRDFQLIPVGNRLPVRLKSFTVPFLKSLQQRGSDCGFYAAYNAILFARQMPDDLFNDKNQYAKVEMEARQRIAQANYAKLPELRARLARAHNTRDRDDIQREIRRRQEVVERSSNITSDDVGIVLGAMEQSIAICGESPRVLIDNFNQNRKNPDFIARYAEVYAADQLTRNLILRIAEFQNSGAGARLVIVASSARLGAMGHWIAVELVKNDDGQIVSRAADSAGQHQELAKNTVVLALEPIIRDLAETITTFYPEEPAPLVHIEELQQDLLISGEFQYPSSSSRPPVKKTPAREKTKPTPIVSQPGSSTYVSHGPDLQTWWNEDAKSRAAFVLPFYRNRSGQKIFILGREAHGTDKGRYSPFGGKWEKKDKTPAAGAAREFSEESGIVLKDALACVNRAEVFAVNSTHDTSRPRSLIAFYIVELTDSEVRNVKNSFAKRRDHEMDQLGEVTEADLLASLSAMGPQDIPSVRATSGATIQLRNLFFRVKNYLRDPNAGIGGRDGVRFQDSRLRK